MESMLRAVTVSCSSISFVSMLTIILYLTIVREDMNIFSSVFRKDRGEIATIVALGTVGILMLGLVVGQYIVQRQTKLPSNAQSGAPDFIVASYNIRPALDQSGYDQLNYGKYTFEYTIRNSSNVDISNSQGITVDTYVGHVNPLFSSHTWTGGLIAQGTFTQGGGDVNFLKKGVDTDFCVLIDPYNYIVENNENNNMTCFVLNTNTLPPIDSPTPTSLPIDQPDLIVERVWVTAASTSGWYTVDFTVKNNSTTITANGPILAASYIDRGTNPPAIPAHDVTTIDVLYPGGSSTRAGVNPVQLAAGTVHDICAKADPYGAIAETDENNNSKCIVFTATGGVAATSTPPSTGNPNLAIPSTPTYTPSSPFDQNGATITATIQNIGTGAVRSGTNLFGTSEVKYELFEHVSGALVCSDTKIVNFDGMQPGGSIGLSIYLPSGTQCTGLLTVGTGYTIRITVDPANRVTESFDTDNERLLLFIPTVGAQAPTITPIPQVQSPSCVVARIVENNNAPGASTKGFKIECQTQNASSHKFFLSYSNTAGQTLTNTYGPSPIDPTTNSGSTNLAVTDMTSMDVICSACEGNVCTPLDNTAVASCKASFVNTLPTATPTPTPPSPLTINIPQGQAQIVFDSTKPQSTP